MEKTKNDIAVHVFVCTNEKKNKECCAPKGGEELRKELKDWAKEQPGWGKRIRVNASGCLDRCTEGIAVAIYPQDKWFVEVSPQDSDELKAEITKLMKTIV